MNPTSILIIEDDRELNQQLTRLLIDKGYQVAQCFDGEEGLLKASASSFDLIILDVMMPKRDGYSLLNILRKSSQVPVIMVTAKGAEEERIRGFSMGADDYVAKPFNTTELIFRIEALLRRARSSQETHTAQELVIDGLLINHIQQKVCVNEQELEFTPIQIKLLWELLLHRGEVLTKAYLYQRVLNRKFGAYDRSLDMHLSRVRRKLSAAHWQGERLQTAHGKGYCFV